MLKWDILEPIHKDCFFYAHNDRFSITIVEGTGSGTWTYFIHDKKYHQNILEADVTLANPNNKDWIWLQMANAFLSYRTDIDDSLFTR